MYPRMLRPRGHVKMKPKAAQSSPTTKLKDELNGGGYKQGSIRHFKSSCYEDNVPKEDSLSLSADIRDLSFAELSFESNVPFQKSIHSDYSLCSYSDTASTSAEIGSYFDFKNINSNESSDNRSKDSEPNLNELEEIVDTFGEYDEIDGFAFRSFTTMDDLEKFVSRSASYQATFLTSSHSLPQGKDTSYCRTAGPSSPDFLRESTGRIDASFRSLSVEPYCEDYEVPRREILNKRQFLDECEKRFCNMGCICDSLISAKPPLTHCNHPECMCHDVCVYKSSIRHHMSSSLTECETCREFSEYDLSLIEQFLPQQWPNLKKELLLQKNIIHQLQLQLNIKQLEFNQLKNQLVNNAMVKKSAILRPVLTRKNVGFPSMKKIKTKMEARAKAKVGNKEETKVAKRLHVNGHYVDSLPFDERVLDRLSENMSVTSFIRHLMRDMFTEDYLSSSSSKWMKEEHKAAIIDATMKRFHIYYRRNGSSIPLTVEMVKQVIKSEFNVKQSRERMNSKKRS
ncbi:uncharacterized protein LOC130695374 isoform X2 [Daphnia carinata]|uniref:uncharacterized protein LOC130695374 isoform X2 n=1 Tax=Daphnia carinata TaxID=120202 RepID=UPI00257F3E8C|nr:uncharacterized protein LOC130695374 isoform X2 [Daphnia carinata]